MRRSLILFSALLLCAVSDPVRAGNTEAQGEITANAQQDTQNKVEDTGKTSAQTYEIITIPPGGMVLDHYDGLPPPLYLKDDADDQDTTSDRDGQE